VSGAGGPAEPVHAGAEDPTALGEHAPCGLLSTTPEGTILQVNETLVRWIGRPRHELVGRRFCDLLTPGGRIYHETHYAPMLQMQGQVREIALDVVRADGTRFPALVNSVLERDAGGAPLLVRTAILDATERRRYEQELLLAKERAERSEAHATLLARTLQQTLIPPSPPQIAGLDLAAVYRPAGRGDEIGGDFYDIFEIGEGDWVVAVGDVCGKGVDAAVVTAVARYTIRAAAVRHPDLVQVVSTLNEVLLREDTDRFCTVALVRLRREPTGWLATITSAGHPLPVLLRDGAAAVSVGVPGTLVGVLPRVRSHDVPVPLRPGDALVLHTDGVTEGRRGDALFGEEGMHAAIAAAGPTADAVTHRILDDVLRFQDGVPSDDIVVVTIRVP